MNKFSDVLDDDLCDVLFGMKSFNDFKNVGLKIVMCFLSGAVTFVRVGRSRVVSFKCDVCKRSKKGKCGIEMVLKLCLLCLEN